MSFKFNLGDVVAPLPDTIEKRLPSEPAEVSAIQLDGLIEIRFPGPPHKLLVEEKYYELWGDSDTIASNR